MSTKIKATVATILFVVFMIAIYLTYKSISADYTESVGTEGVGGGVYGTIDAPDFSLIDAEGNTVRLSDFIGKPVVLNFWASWCGPCQSEMPVFDAAYKAYGNEVVFMMVDLVDGQRETVESGKAFIEKKGYSFPVFFDINSEGAVAYNIYSIPTTFFINREGQVVKFKNSFGQIVAGYQGAIDKTSLEKGIDLIK
ncbi:MAG: TlpA family protein disulfide reductase [Clostridiales bacterium]|nr:TlpA family protein disulfide reductase [Clostridiales bacterium]